MELGLLKPIQANHAFLVVGVDAEVTGRQIEDVLQAVQGCGRVRMRGKTYSREADGLIVLCECSEEIDLSTAPREVKYIDGAQVWKIVVASQAPTAPIGFTEKLKDLLMTEGKTVADLRSYCAAVSSKRDSEEPFFEMMGELLKQVYKGQSESQGYRRLRVFSGITPTPAGEEPLEYWLEQATLMVEESDCPDREKRRRILESLRGPALEIIRVLRFSKPEAKPEEYLEAINSAFGSPETGEDLYFSFHLMQQKSGEKLSDYLRRLEPLLAKVVKKGGVSVRDMDRVRVEQLLRGAVGNKTARLVGGFAANSGAEKNAGAPREEEEEARWSGDCRTARLVRNSGRAKESGETPPPPRGLWDGGKSYCPTPGHGSRLERGGLVGCLVRLAASLRRAKTFSFVLTTDTTIEQACHNLIFCLFMCFDGLTD
uniref:Uncharacterized protein n=1 Tax=Paramormyrops kingsleyae TaxID=1676925 RepID=A0A3B3QYH2_9TELE